MSYNVTAWRTKELSGLWISLHVLLTIDPVTIEGTDSGVMVTGIGVEGFQLKGTLQEDEIIVDDITYFGECSGTRWDEFKAALASSTGRLVATVYWEGGDSVSRLIVENGAVTEEDIDL